MEDYTKKILDEFAGFLGKPANSPAANHLFDIRPDDLRELLPKEQARLFHRYVVQLLFLSTRVRRDIKTAVAFLTTRVKAPDKDDRGKLGRIM